MRTSLSTCLVVVLVTGCSHPSAKSAETWSPEAAAAYLDRRADWWMTWRGAARDHGTFCISCHTMLPYALARPVLGARLGDQGISGREQKLVENVRARVGRWTEAAPYYANRAKDPAKATESRATEAVLNAVILADADARAGRLSKDTHTAFENMWALQQTDGPRSGAWPWLQFGLDPWEGRNAEYFGAALAALATGTAPEAYDSEPAIQASLARLRSYLDREYTNQPLSNRVVLLWASTKLPGLVGEDRRARLIADLCDDQRSDGGWSLESLHQAANGWRPLRRLTGRSDGYATGLVTLVLARTNGSSDGHVASGVAWLARNQNRPEGFWPAYSLNPAHDSEPDVARFMNDAATAYAVLALAEAAPHVR
jgi:squalene-hopene/tetraprenyl-beta-curcumene cyclase